MSDSLRYMFEKRQSRAIKVFIAGALIFSCLVSALAVYFVHNRKARFSEGLILEYAEKQYERELAIAEGEIDESEPFPYPEDVFNSLEQYYSAVNHSKAIDSKRISMLLLYLGFYTVSRGDISGRPDDRHACPGGRQEAHEVFYLPPLPEINSRWGSPFCMPGMRQGTSWFRK